MSVGEDSTTRSQRIDVRRLGLWMSPREDLADVPPNFQAMPQTAPTHQQVVEAGQWHGFVHAYLASTSFVDHCVGKVLAGLASSPHSQNTIVVLWSDHGFHLGEKQHWAKRTLWEESTRVPLVISGPGIKPGPACQQAVSLLDIYPTLIDLCGLTPSERLDGISLAPQLANAAATRRRPVVTSSYEGNHAIRSRHWRYIRYRDGAEELYDHRSDPQEYRNLADSPLFADTKAEMARFVPTDATPEVVPTSQREGQRKKPRNRRADNKPAAK